MDVLDVGCGVGSIDLDLAPALAPGRVVGIDADPGQIETARRSATERGIANVEFVTSSVYELPFEEATFDVVYANAVRGSRRSSTTSSPRL
jgi:ubiquinone/menaquinone biosynthesis C-methylase UbiE